MSTHSLHREKSVPCMCTHVLMRSSTLGTPVCFQQAAHRPVPETSSKGTALGWSSVKADGHCSQVPHLPSMATITISKIKSLFCKGDLGLQKCTSFSYNILPISHVACAQLPLSKCGKKIHQAMFLLPEMNIKWPT